MGETDEYSAPESQKFAFSASLTQTLQEREDRVSAKASFEERHIYAVRRPAEDRHICKQRTSACQEALTPEADSTEEVFPLRLGTASVDEGGTASAESDPPREVKGTRTPSTGGLAGRTEAKRHSQQQQSRAEFAYANNTGQVHVHMSETRITGSAASLKRSQGSTKGY